MKVICERCGRSFPIDLKCLHCGMLVESQDDDMDRQVFPTWGWARISLNAEGALREALLRDLKAMWLKLEEFTVMNLLNSQIGVFSEAVVDVRVLIKRDLLAGLIDNVRADYPQVSVVFDPVEGEFIDATDLNKILDSDKE